MTRKPVAVSGPVTGTKITEPYVRMVARDAPHSLPRTFFLTPICAQTGLPKRGAIRTFPKTFQRRLIAGAGP